MRGDNSNNGTFDAPLQTIQAGIDSLQPGQTLYIREGVYQERIVISESKSGTLEKPTIIWGYPGETPVITGDYSGIGSWNLVLISGSHILFGNAEVSYSSGRGINVYAGESEFLGEAYANSQKYVTLADVEVHHTKNAGIIAEWVDNLTIQSCVLWQNNQINNPDSDFFEDCCWSGAVTVRRGAHFLLEDNKIYESYGEGVNIHGGAIDVTIQDNVVYNTWAPAIYPINSSQITIQRNLIYHTNDSRFLRHNNPPQGVMMGNEHYHMQEHAMTLEDVNVINNMIKGFQINVGFWYNGFESESALVHV